MHSKLTADARMLVPARLPGIHFQIIYVRLAWPSTTSSAHWRHFCL